MKLDNDTYKESLREEGREEGIISNRIENAGNLMDLLPDDVIADRIGLAQSEVEKLRANHLGHEAYENIDVGTAD